MIKMGKESDVQMANRFTKSYSTSLINREKQIKIIMSNYFTSIRMVNIKKIKK